MSIQGTLSISQENKLFAVIGVLLSVVVLLGLSKIIGAVVLGVFGYYATRPLYRHISRHTNYDSVAAGTALVMFFVPLVLFIVHGLLTGLNEIETFAAQYEGTIVDTVLEQFFDISVPSYSAEQLIQIISSGNIDLLQRVLESVMSSAGLITHVLLTVFLAAVVVFYGLRDGHKLKSLFVGLFESDDIVRKYIKDVDRDLKYIFFGNLLNAAIAAILAIILYQGMNVLVQPVFHIPYPFILGVATGLTSLIPVIGMKIVYGPLLVYLFGNGLALEPTNLGTPIAFAVFVIVIVDLIPDIVLRPYITGRDIHIGLLLGAYIVGPILFGWYGLFLGPIVLILATHFTLTVFPTLLNQYTA